MNEDNNRRRSTLAIDLNESAIMDHEPMLGSSSNSNSPTQRVNSISSSSSSQPSEAPNQPQPQDEEQQAPPQPRRERIYKPKGLFLLQKKIQ